MNLLNLLGVCMILVLTLYLAAPALVYILHFRRIREKDQERMTIRSTFKGDDEP